MKKSLKFLCVLMAAGIAAGAAGCSNKVPDTEETLEVYCRDAGYGYAWCEALLAAFNSRIGYSKNIRIFRSLLTKTKSRRMPNRN